METGPEQVGEEIAASVDAAIDAANDRADDRAELAEAILDGAMETERAREVRNLERDVDECLSNQASLSEAMAGMAGQLEQVLGKLSILEPLLLSQTLPSPEADGQPESPEVPEPVQQPEAPPPAPPPAESPQEKPRRKKTWL